MAHRGYIDIRFEGLRSATTDIIPPPTDCLPGQDLSDGFQIAGTGTLIDIRRDAMRPQTIVNFERIVFATLILGLLQSYLGWERSAQMTSAGFVITVQAVTVGLIAGLTLLVAHRRSRVAKWIMIVLFALGLPVFFKTISHGAPLSSVWITVLQTGGQLIAYSLLFSDSARYWFSERN